MQQKSRYAEGLLVQHSCESDAAVDEFSRGRCRGIGVEGAGRYVKKPRHSWLLVLVLALLLSGCAHLRPPDDYCWKDKSGDPGGVDPATATLWDFERAVGDNASRKAERDFRNSLPQVPMTH